MINFSCFNINNKIPICNIKQKPAFKGHTGIEEYGKNGISRLIHQTAFFRDYQTKKFVVDYIHKNFNNKDNVKIIVGACSTGEEALSLSMMLSGIGQKADILGIDLGEKAIKQANGKKYLLQKADIDDFLMLGIIDKYDDWYLGFDVSGHYLFPHEKEQRKMFTDFFTPSRTPQYKEKLMDYTGVREGRHIKNLETRIFKLKRKKGENCKFVVGDIMNLGKITKGKKSDVIFFSNALYHLTSDFNREKKNNAAKIMDKLAKIFRANININGLVCFGEKEKAEGVDTELLKKVMEQNGFEAISILKRNETLLPDSIFAKDEKNYTQNVFRRVY